MSDFNSNNEGSNKGGSNQEGSNKDNFQEGSNKDRTNKDTSHSKHREGSRSKHSVKENKTDSTQARNKNTEKGSKTGGNDNSSGSFFQVLASNYKIHQLSPVSRIENIDSSSLVKMVILAVCFLVVFFIVWAYFTRIEEIVSTKGEIIPLNKVYDIQHLEGGTIKEIFVKEGQEVMAGDILVKFDPAIPTLELEQLRAKNATILSHTEELQELVNKSKSYVGSEGKIAQGESKKESKKTEAKKSNIPQSAAKSGSGGKAVAAGSVGSKVKTKSSTSESTSNITSNTTHKATSVKTTSSKSAIIKEHTSTASVYKKQAQEDISKFETLLQILEKRLIILYQEREIYENLYDKGVVSKKDYLELLRIITQTEEEINRAKSAYLETQYAIKKLEERLNNVELRSPVHGIVKGLTSHVGNVIQPGGFLMQVVPIENLMAESRIPAADIGLVKIGDPVKVKIDTYDYTRYGVINGKLIHISATTFLDEKGQAYYKGETEIEQSYVGNDPDQHRLLPGMTLIADINAGYRSLLIYLLRPIRVIAGSAFQEPSR